jgi:hypothetical protein
MAAKSDFAQRTKWMRSFLDAEHFRYRRFATDGPQAEEIALTSDWLLEFAVPATPLTKQMRCDFETFCERCLALRFSGSGGGTIRWRLHEPLAASESFAITVADKEVVIAAQHERGLLHGTHYLERLMADRGAPWLPRGRSERAPRFSPRISNGVFIEADQKVEKPGAFSDEYLSLMSHFGVNGIHLYVNLWDVCRNSILPELNSAGLDARIAALNAFNERTLRFGIDLYLHINSPPLGPTHPVFQHHPETRGARVEIFLQEFESVEHYNLCSGNERVLDCYAATVENLFTAAPNLAGAVVIVGGECFYHCFTRPAPSEQGLTNCPHCRAKSPSDEVAHLVNRLAAAVKCTGRHKSLYAWPYSAFVWSGKDRAQLWFMEKLSPDVSFLGTFDTGSEDRVNGDGVFLFDYNIKSIGPSEVFAAQADRCAEMRRPIFTKTETNTTPDTFFVPYLPVHHRWHRRFQAMAKAGVAGFIGQWRFFGMNGSPPEELQYHATWNPERDTDLLLMQMAQRDFGITSEAAEAVVAAWRKLSEAWDSFPYSALMSGERAGYMRGPFYLGPAHPLIFNAQNDYRLGPKFRTLRGDALELLTPDAVQEAIRRAPPRYVSDLLFTVPFGAQRCWRLLSGCRAYWWQGLEALKAALGPAPSARAQMELDVCETIWIHLTATANVLDFYRTRDGLHRDRFDIRFFNFSMDGLARILRDEIANAERILPILARDPRIGYGHCYGIVYDAEMVREKLRQCEYVLNTELPRLASFMRFHLWNEYP